MKKKTAQKSGEKGKAESPQNQLSPLECLRKIRPPESKDRFLIAWNPESRVLCFGCGGGENAVLVCSDRTLHKAGRISVYAKLRPECAERFNSGEPGIDGHILVERLKEVLRSYVHLNDERLYSMLSVWIIASYMYPVFSHLGYLFFYSKFPRSGKTRVEEVLSHLCFEATRPLNAPTVPTIREFASEGHTLVLDTLERWREKSPEAFAAAMEFFDAGYRNGGTVAKMVQAGDGKWVKVTFPVYAPYVLAGISKNSLTDTALDRSFAIEMHRKSTAIKKRKYGHNLCEQECITLRDDLYRWALENAASLAAIYDGAQLEAEVDSLELNDRAADICKPLLAVAHHVGDRELSEQLASLFIEMFRDPEAKERDRAGAILRSLRMRVNGTGDAMGITSDFVTHLLADGVEVKEAELHSMLTQWGFSQKSVRLDDGPRRGWVLQDDRMAEIEEEISGGIHPLEM